MNQTTTRPTHLAHHFSGSEQQKESAKLGMWIFLLTEVLLFGGLFCFYAIYFKLGNGFSQNLFYLITHFFTALFLQASFLFADCLGLIISLAAFNLSLTSGWSFNIYHKASKQHQIALLRLSFFTDNKASKTILCTGSFHFVSVITPPNPPSLTSNM